MVFIAAGEKLTVFQPLDFPRYIAPQATSNADQAGTFISVDDVLDIDAPARRQRLLGPMIQAPRSTRQESQSPSIPAADVGELGAARGSAFPHSPVAIAHDMLQFHTLREQTRGALTEFQLFFKVDKPATDVVVSLAQKRAEPMVALLLAGAGPLEIEWMYQMRPGDVVGFLDWLTTVPTPVAIQYMRTSTIRATLGPMFGAMHQAGMMHSARPGLGYALCRNLAAVFSSPLSDLDKTQTALQNGGLVSFANALYQRGPTWGLAMLRTLVAHDEAKAGAEIIERNLAIAVKLTGSSKKIVRSIYYAKKPGYALERALSEEGLNAEQIEHCKDYLIRYKAEVLIENMFAKVPVEANASTTLA